MQTFDDLAYLSNDYHILKEIITETPREFDPIDLDHQLLTQTINNTAQDFCTDERVIDIKSCKHFLHEMLDTAKSTMPSCNATRSRLTARIGNFKQTVRWQTWCVREARLYHQDQNVMKRLLTIPRLVLYEDKKPASEVAAGNKIEKKHNEWPNGKVKETWQIVDGSITGPWQYFNEDGKLIESGWKINGLHTGLWTTYRPDGSVSKTGTYREGSPIGRWQWFYPDYQLQAEGFFMFGFGRTSALSLLDLV